VELRGIDLAGLKKLKILGDLAAKTRGHRHTANLGLASDTACEAIDEAAPL